MSKRKRMISKRRFVSLSIVEMILLLLFLSGWLAVKMDWHWTTCLATFIEGTIITIALFFKLKILRFVFAVLFSGIWSLMIYELVYVLSNSLAASVLITGIAFSSVLAFHARWYSRRIELTHHP